jgi:pyruvate dehydrogenase E2 component (dihydrolipoamide acetyltransferase)
MTPLRLRLRAGGPEGACRNLITTTGFGRLPPAPRPVGNPLRPPKRSRPSPPLPPPRPPSDAGLRRGRWRVLAVRMSGRLRVQAGALAADASGGATRVDSAGGAAGAVRVGPVPAAPATRRLARELGVDLASVTATGPGGRVTDDDVRAASGGAERRTVAPVEAAPERGEAKPLKTIGAEPPLAQVRAVGPGGATAPVAPATEPSPSA